MTLFLTAFKHDCTHHLRRLRTALVLCMISVSITACNTERKNDVPEAGSQEALDLALKDAVDTQIIPEFRAFKTEAENLNTRALAFCNSMTSNNLAALQSQWETLSEQWSRAVIYNLGPLNDDLIFPKIIFIESMRQRGTDYTDTVRAEIDTALGGSLTLSRAYFDNLTFTKTGMLALEVLIFESTIGTHSTDPADIMSDYQGNALKCDYLQGMAQLLGRHADYLVNGWENDHLGSGTAFRDVMLSGELDDGSEPIVKLITAIQEHLDYVKARKLEAILDARISGHTYINILATLNQIEQLLEGGGDDVYSFFDHMEGVDYTTQVNQVRSNLTQAKLSANSADRSALAAAVGFLDGNFKREIPQGLQVTLGINFSDGD